MLLEVDQLETSFQTPKGRFNAVDKVSFHVEAGKTLGIVGESGSGKSVTALSIMRLIQEPAGQIHGGKILFNGNDLLKIPLNQMRQIRGKRISMIFQEPMTSLNPVFTVGNQIEEAILLHQKTTKAQARKKCLEVMELVGIPDVEQRIRFYPHELSGGLRQRVMIAMALSCEPELLIADEPTTALDVTIQAQILRLMKDLQKRFGMALIMITHDFGVIAEVADRVLVMYGGKIVERGNVQEIFNQPKHPYTRALQLAIPTPEKRGQALYSIPFMVPSLMELAQGVELDSRWERLEKDLSEMQSSDSKNESTATEQKEKGPTLVEVKDLKVHYPIHGGFLGRTIGTIKAVDGVDFKIYKGEVLGLVGESGCGKSTLGKALIRLLPPTDGKILYEGQDLITANQKKLRQIRRKVQMIFQDPYSSLNPRMRVGDILEEAFVIHSLHSPKTRRAKALELLEIVGLRPESYRKYPHEFSGGQRQRIGIARAIAVQPDFIVADEPVSALDVSIQAQILNLLKELKKDFELTYLFVSHDLNVVHYLCDRILVMYDGKFVEELTPQQLMDPNYQVQEYTHTLLNSIPSRQPKQKS